MSGKIIPIDGSLTIECVGELQELLRNELGQCGATTVTFDLTEVTDIDGAGLQLLLAFAKALEKVNAQLRLQHAPEKTQQILAKYGVANRFLQGELA